MYCDKHIVFSMFEETRKLCANVYVCVINSTCIYIEENQCKQNSNTLSNTENIFRSQKSPLAIYMAVQM